MRPLSPVLAQELQRADTTAREIFEVVQEQQQDIRDTAEEWALLDSTANLVVLEDGGVALEGASKTHIASTTTGDGSTNIGALPEPFSVPIATAVEGVYVEWAAKGGRDPSELVIESATAHLDPDVSTQGRVVETWTGQLFEVARIVTDPQPEDFAPGPVGQFWELLPLTARVSVPAGAAPGEVLFNFRTARLGGPARVGRAPQHIDGATGQTITIPDTPTQPLTVFLVWALDAEGKNAGNVAWASDETVTQPVEDGLHEAWRFSAERFPTAQSPGTGSAFQIQPPRPGMPYFKFQARNLETVTATFSTNPLTLPGTIENTLELVAEGLEPSDSTLAYEIDAGGGTWLPFQSGDRIGEGTLAPVPRTSPWNMRVTLTAGTRDDVGPTCKRLGVRQIDGQMLDGLAAIGDPTCQVDPITLQSQVGELHATLLREGEVDYRSFVEDLFALRYPAQVEFRLWVGSPNVDRAHWMHIESYLLDDVQFAANGGGVDVVLVSPLALTLRDIPGETPDGSGGFERRPIQFNKTPISQAYTELLDQVGLPTSRRGPGIPPSAPETVSKRIPGPVAGREELDALAAVGGFAVISSQGRLKAVDFYGENSSAPDVRFTYPELKPRSITPGYRARLARVYCPYGWDDRADDGNGAYAGEAIRVQQEALDNLGVALVDVEERVGDATAQYVEAFAQADTIADRLARRFGAGLLEWAFETAGAGAHPELEPGDVVAVEVDRFVGKSPLTGEAIRGFYWAQGRVTAVENAMGTRFRVVLDSWADLRPSSKPGNRLEYARPEVLEITATFRTDGADFAVRANSDSGSVRLAVSRTGPPNRTAVRAEQHYPTDAEFVAAVPWNDSALQNDETLYVTALAYETDAGLGAESVVLWEGIFQYARPVPMPSLAATFDPDGTCRLEAFGDARTANIYLTYTVDAGVPADPTPGAHDLSLPGPGGTVATTQRVRESGIVRAKAVSQQTDGQLSPVTYKTFVRGEITYRKPFITATATRINDTVTVEITVTERNPTYPSAIDVRFRMREGLEGGAVLDPNWRTDFDIVTGNPGDASFTRGKYVQVDAGLDAEFLWEVRYRDTIEGVATVGDSFFVTDIQGEEKVKTSFVGDYTPDQSSTVYQIATDISQNLYYITHRTQAGAPRDLLHGLQLPPGVTVTKVEGSYSAVTGTSAAIKLWEQSLYGGLTFYFSQPLASTNGVWTAFSVDTSAALDASSIAILEITFEAPNLDDVKFGPARVTYLVPTYFYSV